MPKPRICGAKVVEGGFFAFALDTETGILMNGLENRAIKKVVVQAQNGETLEFLVKAILLTPDNKPFALVDEKGDLRPASAQSNVNNTFTVLFFSGLWIDGDQVWTLDILTKDKKMLIGELISIG